jgi:hypothetical protein
MVIADRFIEAVPSCGRWRVRHPFMSALNFGPCHRQGPRSYPSLSLGYRDANGLRPFRAVPSDQYILRDRLTVQHTNNAMAVAGVMFGVGYHDDGRPLFIQVG